jgi:hypothetical protein
MLIKDFGARAQECIAWAKRAKSEHDRQLFVTMARAWCGVTGEQEDGGAGAPAGLGRRLAMARRYAARR